MRCIPAILFMLILNLSLLADDELIVHFQYASFYDSTNEPYVELFFLIPAKQLIFKEVDIGNYSAAVQLNYTIYSGEKVSLTDSYILKSEELTNGAGIDFSLIDLKRHNLSPGTYLIVGKISDVNNPSKKTSFRKEIKVKWKSDDIDFSQIVLIDQYYPSEKKNQYSKWGWDIIPYAADFFPPNRQKLSFYAEVYGSKNNEAFVCTYTIEKDGAVVLSNFKKMEGRPLDIILTSFDISALDGGNYEVSLEARDKENNIVAAENLIFAISHDPVQLLKDQVTAWDHEELRNQTAALTPLADMNETQAISALLKGDQEKEMRKYYLEFWHKRYQEQMVKAWEIYQKELKIVEYQFSTIIDKGYEADRGYIYLKYGAPNEIVSNSEAGSIDYEIWHYYSLNDGQSNVRFVFYNPSRVPNDYELLHSTAIGEVNDDQWKFKIYEGFGSMNGSSDIDATEFRDFHGSRLDNAFNF